MTRIFAYQFVLSPKRSDPGVTGRSLGADLMGFHVLGPLLLMSL